jgi:hypothetical protein
VGVLQIALGVARTCTTKIPWFPVGSADTGPLQVGHLRQPSVGLLLLLLLLL